ncbi:MAG: hypothetical protein J6S63_10950 [Atopobiaceae bacterium]|nr:hypothetical protein [Atopobiaceae bacterium]
MRYRVWSEGDPEGYVRETSDALTDNPPRDCTVRLDEVCECAMCGRLIRVREGHPSLDLHVACHGNAWSDDGSDYPALVCAECARAEGQEVPEPATDAERIEALERNVGLLVSSLREVAAALAAMTIGMNEATRYLFDGDETVAE